MKNFSGVLLSVFFFLVFFKTSVFAQSKYVLPYPSRMPGNLSYAIHLIYESISRYWYFGDFGQFDYNLKMADKYLVEAKTLFEYKQYLLGYGALKKSDKYFINAFPNLARAKKNGKNILQKKAILNEASQKHMEVLVEMGNSVPGTFIWKPEKLSPTILYLKKAIEESIHLREKNI